MGPGLLGHAGGGESGTAWVTPRPGHPPLHGQGLQQEGREDGLLVVVRQQKDALDEGVSHVRVIHYQQVDQDGAQDLRHLGRGGASLGSLPYATHHSRDLNTSQAI